VTQRTSIEWCDKSSNPLRGFHIETGKRGWFCVHASAGCRNCYAEKRNRWIGNGLLYRAQDAHLVRFEMGVKELQSWQRLPSGTKVFSFDMTDLFQEGVSDSLIDQAFAGFACAPHVTFQVLTKRADRARRYLSDEGARGAGLVQAAWHLMEGDPGEAPKWPLQNVWLGVSVEDQATADERIPLLLQTPAAVRFVSYEPALGPVDFDISRWGKCYHPRHEGRDHEANHRDCSCHLDWVIVGGESGPRARPFDVAWARSTVEQCKAVGVAVFVKQLGARPIDVDHSADEAHGDDGVPKVTPIRLASKKGGDPSEWPEDLRVREFPR
jgi:protein gp37